MEFLELIESINADAASSEKVFGNEGRRIVPGQSADYKKNLAEAADLVANLVKRGNGLDKYRFEEAMSTSDFPVYFGDIIDRQVLASYEETPQTFDQWCKVSEVADFRPAKRFASDGGEASLRPVDELGEYKAVSRTESEILFSVKKFGARFDISWESILNDDLSVLTDQPVRFGKAARRTEEREATKLLFTRNFFSDKNDNLMTGNALSIQGLQAAMEKFSEMVDSEGEPIMVGPAILMVPPALEIPARNILNATELQIYDNDSEAFQYRTTNWMTNRLSLVVNPYLPILDKSDGNNTYYLMADPSTARGAVEFAFLRGHREPELFMKSPNAVSVSGGMAGAMDGDFDHDGIGYKVRHVMGGTTIDPKCAIKITATA